MKALSVRQPWAWLIIHGGKDIENRDWYTGVRGRVLIHASKGMTQREYLSAAHDVPAMRELGHDIPEMPSPYDLFRGGVIGSVEIVDCVENSDSPWFFGRFGFVLRDPKPLPFEPGRGALGFFDWPEVSCHEQ